MEWSGGDEWRKEGLGEWSVDGSNGIAGKIRSSGGLTFVTVDGAGHMVRDFMIRARLLSEFGLC